MIKQVTEVDSEFMTRLESSIEEIKRGLKNFNVIPEGEFLTADEFMSRVKISRWKFDMLVDQGLLQYKKIGRKFYIPINQVAKYFDGQMVPVKK